MSTKKEPFYFDFDIKSRVPLSLDQYESFFCDANDQHTIVAEASTRYLQSKVAVSEIVRYAPSAKFVVMLRNPVDMAYALHSQALATGGETVADFWQAWQLQEIRARGLEIPAGCPDKQLLQYSDICSTGDQLERVYKTVGSGKVHVIFLDDMERSPEAEYSNLLSFLELPEDNFTDFRVYNKAKKARYQHVQRLLKRAADVKIALGIKWRPGISRLNRIEQERPKLDQNTRRLLQEHFLPQIEKIEELISRDLHHWKAG